MRQIIQLDDKLKLEIMNFEKSCEQICQRQKDKYYDLFNKKGKQLAVELIREKKGKIAAANEVFDENYESYIETGIVEEDEYFPDAYIPLWKCKNEWFQIIGYMNEDSLSDIEKKLEKIILEMLEEA
ncbi:hypothetical protein [Bacillus methanolicus]|uniref:Uncharacterized protein n=1 Tax=Bacillus methanolicus (strain MGA3 / ATCC 53907) TaxID=796606 RepID=I3E9I9_BACMM|nr:hypothetical protein [Bacillus methanolicus]AIE60408.1 hypothetical protein BMMGA3_10060 [Bacillus methanolicus MGA3]EIJ83160.1 hypothetical protein MGA3_08060 [Bacillus methanolicus MGA3]